MLFFWHRYELPAVVNGRVRLEHPRQGTSASSPVSARSMQEEELDSGRESSFTEQQHDHTTAPIHSPRSIFGRSHSFNTAASGRLSRTSSTGGMFHPDDDDDDGSYMYFMDGEVVMHRNQPRPSSPFSTTSESNAPNENQSSSSAMSTEPRRNSRRERFVNDLETLVASAVSTDEDSESFGRAPPANSGSTGVGIDASNTTPQPLSREQSRTESCVYQDDGNETSALQAILNVMEVEELESERGPSLDETSDPDDSPDSLLAPPSSIFR